MEDIPCNTKANHKTKLQRKVCSFWLDVLLKTYLKQQTKLCNKIWWDYQIYFNERFSGTGGFFCLTREIWDLMLITTPDVVSLSYQFLPPFSITKHPVMGVYCYFYFCAHSFFNQGLVTTWFCDALTPTSAVLPYLSTLYLISQSNGDFSVLILLASLIMNL